MIIGIIPSYIFKISQKKQKPNNPINSPNMSKPTIYLNINKFYAIVDIYISIRDYIILELKCSNITAESIVYMSKTDDILKSLFNIEFKYDFNLSEYDPKNQEWHDIKNKKRKITKYRLKEIKKQVALFKLQLA